MPEVDGYKLCERLRHGPAGADVQIVVLSALDGTDGKVRALELGADEYLVKPVESRELVTRIKVCSTALCGSANGGRRRAEADRRRRGQGWDRHQHRRHQPRRAVHDWQSYGRGRAR